MSTSPDTQKRNEFSNQAVKVSRTNPGRGRPGLILLKGLFWLALIVGLLVALAMNYEIVWGVMVNTIGPGLVSLFDFAESALDSFYLLVGVGAFAPMATAYTGFVIALALLYLLSRKGIKIYHQLQTKKEGISQTYASAWDEWYGTLRERAVEKWTAWWSSLDIYNKAVAIVFMVLIGIPVLLLLSIILGNLVANLL